MDSLPPELILNVMLHLSKDDISQCLEVCQSWYAKMSPIHYQKIQVKRNHQEFLEQTEKICLDGKKLGDFAQSIIFSSSPETYVPWSEAEFCSVLNNLPYLRKIHFDSAIDEYAYLMETVDVDKLKYVQELTARVTSSDIKDIHLSNNVVLKDKVTKLYIANEMGDITPIRRLGGYDSFFEILSSFKRLKDLEINNQGLHIPNYYESILNSCTNLVSLRLKTLCRCTFPDIDYIKQPQLESLDLDIEEGLIPKNLDYIMDYLPNLKKLKLHSFRSTKSLFDQTTDQCTKFLAYLQKVTQFEFEEIHECYSSALQHINFVQNKSFWSFIHQLVGEGYLCNLKMCMRHKRSVNKTSVSVDRQKKIIDIENGVWFNGDAFDETWIKELYFLTFRSIIITTNSVLLDDNIRVYNYGRIINPLIDMLKRTKENYLSYIRIQDTFINYTLKFVSTKSFDQQKQLEQSCKEDFETNQKCFEAAQQLMKDYQLSLCERVHVDKIKDCDVDYLVECKETSD